MTLTRDAAHAMKMYRGKGENHGNFGCGFTGGSVKRMGAGEVELSEVVKWFEEKMQRSSRKERRRF